MPADRVLIAVCTKILSFCWLYPAGSQILCNVCAISCCVQLKSVYFFTVFAGVIFQWRKIPVFNLTRVFFA